MWNINTKWRYLRYMKEDNCPNKIWNLVEILTSILSMWLCINFGWLSSHEARPVYVIGNKPSVEAVITTLFLFFRLFRAFPAWVSNFGTLSCHISKNFNFLELVFHHFSNPWNSNFNHPIKIFVMNSHYNTQLIF